MIVIHRNYLIFWIFINAIAELVADLVVRSFFDDGEGRWFLGGAILVLRFVLCNGRGYKE
ncbi:MAG: hypothetical protein ACK51U_03900 [bacterium]